MSPTEPAGERPTPERAALTKALDIAVGGVLFNASNYPPRVQTPMLGQDFSALRGKVVDAVLAILPAHAGGNGVMAERVEALAREKADAEAIAQRALPYSDLSWAIVRHQHVGPILADLEALGIEVRR